MVDRFPLDMFPLDRFPLDAPLIDAVDRVKGLVLMLVFESIGYGFPRLEGLSEVHPFD